MKPFAVRSSIIAITALGLAGLLSTTAGAKHHPSREDHRIPARAAPAERTRRLVFSGGRLWARDRLNNSIAVLDPSPAPANSFLPIGRRHPRGVDGTLIRFAVPGPGKLRVDGAGGGRR